MTCPRRKISASDINFRELAGLLIVTLIVTLIVWNGFKSCASLQWILPASDVKSKRA
jgi:hypothetical protein